MKPAIRTHYIRRQNDSMRLLSQQAHKIVLRAYRKQKPHVIDFVRTGKSVKRLQHELPYFYKESIKPIWEASLKQVWNNAAEEADSIMTEWIAPDAVRKAWGDTVDSWLQEHAGARIDGIVNTDQEWLANTIRSGESGGLSIDQIAGNLSGEFDSMSSGRAGTIARTEMAGAYNYSSQETAKELMAEGSTKVWLTTSGTPRPAHAYADGQEVPIGEPFDVDGEDLMYPGDPSGSDGNVINCLCVVEYNTPSGGAEGEDE